MTPDPAMWTADVMLRGVVGGVLLFHVAHLLGPGPRPAVRAALVMFTLSLIGYLFCQRAELLLMLPRAAAVVALTLCVSATAWLWLAARALFTDGFRFVAWPLGAALGLVVLGLAANLPRWAVIQAGEADPGASVLTALHAVAMLAFTAAAVWEVVRGGRVDLVEPRRAARRWVALGIGAYAALALVVELAVRERPVGPLLPALHVAGIGAIALALAVVVARHSLDAVLGLGEAVPPMVPVTPGRAIDGVQPSPVAETEAAAPAPAPLPPSPAMQALMQAMTGQRLYRREGLSLADLANTLAMGEAALRALINQQLGFRNFNDFLHHYRLQEAAARLVAEDLPILTIALDSGYGSIGPFNRAFRQRYGMTPTEYRAGARMARPPQAAGPG